MALTTYTAGEVLTALSLNDNFTYAAALANSSTAFTGGQQVTTSTSYVGLTTATAVTITTGTSALVVATAFLELGTNNAQGRFSYAVSGATTVAASNNYSGSFITGGAASYSGSTTTVFYVHTGLTPGSNTFTMQYKVSADAIYCVDRRITVFPL
jgi:predicted small secreted protein